MVAAPCYPGQTCVADDIEIGIYVMFFKQINYGNGLITSYC